MKSYVFGPFRLDLGSGELRNSGDIVPLEPRVFALLTHMVDHRGQLLSRAELLETIWRDAHVSDASLSQAVSSLREALQDNADDPHYIETAPRRGYRFIANTIEDPEMPRLTFRVAYGSNNFILAPGANIIGRAGNAAVRIVSKKVSRHHARIIVAASSATIEDLGSKNGTIIGGEKIAGPRDLQAGAEILIGDVTLTFDVSQAVDTAETAG